MITISRCWNSSWRYFVREWAIYTHRAKPAEVACITRMHDCYARIRFHCSCLWYYTPGNLLILDKSRLLCFLAGVVAWIHDGRWSMVGCQVQRLRWNGTCEGRIRHCSCTEFSVLTPWCMALVSTIIFFTAFWWILTNFPCREGMKDDSKRSSSPPWNVHASGQVWS